MKGIFGSFWVSSKTVLMTSNVGAGPVPARTAVVSGWHRARPYIDRRSINIFFTTDFGFFILWMQLAKLFRFNFCGFRKNAYLCISE
jgi:hypothetical protein